MRLYRESPHTCRVKTFRFRENNFGNQESCSTFAPSKQTKCQTESLDSQKLQGYEKVYDYKQHGSSNVNVLHYKFR